jgi:hypothetical protein
MNNIKAECEACGATGLYCGFAEPKGTAVVCYKCKGTGCQEIQYTPFTARKRRKDVKNVLCDGGAWFARNGNEKTITVNKFYNDPH